MNNNKPRIFLKEIRKEMGLSQRQVAKKIKISNTYYQQIEKGERNPGFSVAIRISDFFNIELRRLKG
jgi:putative transcriptional regulator